MEETNAISDRATITSIYAPYLDLLDPLCGLKRADRPAGGRNLGVYRTNNGYPRVTGQRRLRHPRKLKASERHMVSQNAGMDTLWRYHLLPWGSSRLS